MFFITNRMIRQGLKSKAGRKITFRLGDGGYSEHVFYCERHGVNEYTEATSSVMMERIREGDYKEIILFVHGYNTLPEGQKEDGVNGLFQAAEALQASLDAFSPNSYLLLPIMWPTDDDRGMLKDYWDDRMSARAAGTPLARVMAKFIKWRKDGLEEDSCFKRINLICHSMGALVLQSTLETWQGTYTNVPRLFRSIFMFAADIPNETLHRGQAGHAITDACSAVSVYHASDDLAMLTSKVVNIGEELTRRLGHTGPEDMSKVPSNVVAIDCNDFNSDADPTGHGYYLRGKDGGVSPAFMHMAHTLHHGRVDVKEPIRRSLSEPNRLVLPSDYKNALF
ncbi:MAG: alpha/beta hydrolase [Pseudomonadota bacterium]